MVSHVRLENQQNYRQQVCLSCMTGMYGCRWKRYRRSTEPTTVVEKIWIMISILAFAFMAMWLYYWIIAQNSSDDFNSFVYDTMQGWFHWFTLFFTLTVLFFVYTTFLVLLATAHCITGQQLHLHIVHKVLIVLVIAACIPTCVFLTQLWPEEWDLVFVSLQVTAPILQILGVVILTLLTWPLAGIWWRSTSSLAFRSVTLVAYSILLAFFYLCPLFFVTPCMLGHNSLPPRPLIMAHRGAEELAPENTQLSFEKAAGYNIYGFESDVRISLDGIPFLMHDETLERTTNVHKIFPNRTQHRAESFTFAELQKLDAGSFYLKKDPYYNAKRLSSDEKDQVRNQTILSLTQLVLLAKEYNKTVIFDLFGPGSSHPFGHNYVNVTVNAILSTGIKQHQIWWLSGVDRQRVIQQAPNFIQTSEPKSPEVLRINHIKNINGQYSEVTEEDVNYYKTLNISTNVYIVNKPWLYSLYWCIGVHSVTTKSCQVLSKVKAPIWHTTPTLWLIIWILEDSVSMLCVVLIFVFQRYRETQQKRYRFPRRPSNPEAISLHANRPISTSSTHSKKDDRELLYRSTDDTQMPSPDEMIINRHSGYEDIPSPDSPVQPDLPAVPQHEE